MPDMFGGAGFSLWGLVLACTKTHGLKSLCGNFQIFVGHGFTGCGKTRFWCHSERSEESLFDLSPMHREILRFAQNDKRTFSAACSAVPRGMQYQRGFSRWPVR